MRSHIHFTILRVTSIAVGPSAPPIIPTEADSELHPNKPSTQINSKTNATNFFTPITPFSNSYLSFYFIASFEFVLQTCRAKPIPLCRAGVYSRRLIGVMRCYGESKLPPYLVKNNAMALLTFAHQKSLRLPFGVRKEPPLCKGRWQPQADGGVVKAKFRRKTIPQSPSVTAP